MQRGLQASLEKPSGGPASPSAPAGDQRYDLEADAKVPSVLPSSLPVLELFLFSCSVTSDSLRPCGR